VSPHPVLLHLPEPVGWIALSPDVLRAAQALARESLGAAPEPNAEGVPSAPVTALLTAKAAARFLAVDPSWLLRQAREGRVPSIRLGRYVRFDPGQIVVRCTKVTRPD
jgi:hypothetical protein